MAITDTLNLFVRKINTQKILVFLASHVSDFSGAEKISYGEIMFLHIVIKISLSFCVRISKNFRTLSEVLSVGILDLKRLLMYL